MKYVVFLGDGMADLPVKELDGKTPLMVAKKPNIDALAPKSEIGLAKTVPDGMKPGSDTANLSVMGYDPRTCYSGRSPLEALSMGLTLSDNDVAVRCNLVTLSSEEEHYADKRMIDYSAGEITTEEARELISYLEEHLGDDRVSFHPGISYRHCLIVHDAKVGSELTPPHDITGKLIKRNLPSGELGELFLDLMMKSYDLLKDHPVNLKRVAEGKNPANSIWLWGEGTKPNLPDFEKKNGIKGAVISAVDLLKGIGKGAGMEVIEVEGATGGVVTDFAAKGRAAIDALGRVDYVYVHVEAPDESGHQGLLPEKINAIEKIDSDIVGPVLSYLEDSGEAYHVLVCPDHPTPLSVRTHTADPIPYLIYKSDVSQNSGVDSYDEETAKSTGVYVDEGWTLIDRLLSSEAPFAEDGISPDLVITDGGEEIRLNEDSTESPEKEDETEPSEEQAQAKPKKKRSFAAFFKKHLLLFLIAIGVLLLAGGLTAGHFIATYHLSFIRSEESLAKALSKKQVTTLVFKSDVTISSDLVLSRPVDFDLNGHTLNVDGDLTIPLEKDVRIGYKKNGFYRKGGKIVADAIEVSGTKNLLLYADVEAGSTTISAAKIDVKGDNVSENTSITMQSADITYSGDVKGKIVLLGDSVMTYCGKADRIYDGKTVTVKCGEVGSVFGTETLYVYENASVKGIYNVGAYYQVTRLATPEKVLVLQENGDFVCYVSEVIGATHLDYSLNGVPKTPVPMTSGTTVIVLNSDDLTPGRQTLVFKATAPNDPRFLDSEEKSYSFEFSARLATPALSVSEEADKVILTINPVKHADKYVYVVDGVAVETKESVNDVTDKVTAGGVHIFEVKAQSDNKYFSESNSAMTSYVKHLVLAAPIVTASKEIDLESGWNLTTLAWQSVEGATGYRIRYGENEIYTTETSYTEAFDLGNDLMFGTSNVTVQAIGGGYYLDSAVTTVTAAEIAAA